MQVRGVLCNQPWFIGTGAPMPRLMGLQGSRWEALPSSPPCEHGSEVTHTWLEVTYPVNLSVLTCKRQQKSLFLQAAEKGGENSIRAAGPRPVSTGLDPSGGIPSYHLCP